MSNVGPIGTRNSSAIDQTARSSRAPAPDGSDRDGRGHDKVELSRAAQLLSKITKLPDVRRELVERVRYQIAAGTYETSEKIEAALSALLSEEETD